MDTATVKGFGPEDSAAYNVGLEHGKNDPFGIQGPSRITARDARILPHAYDTYARAYRRASEEALKAYKLEPLGTTNLNEKMPDGRSFVWGKVTNLHYLGPYCFVEFLRDNSHTFSVDKANLVQTHGQTQWHAFVNERDTSYSYDSLEAAMAGAVAYKVAGLNTQAAMHFMKMLDADHGNADKLTRQVTP